MTERRARRHDPERRERILDACLDVVGDVGVAGASTRRIAAAADVPLGSLTYHFDGVDELLHEAFERFTRRISDRFETYLGGAADVEQARRAVVELITVDLLADPRELVLTHELYTLAARDPRYRRLTHAWMARSRHALERHFDPATARLLDALIEGLTIHRALDTEPHERDEVRHAVALVTRAPAGPVAAPPGPAAG
ncbi:TetR/AcrR family transcriptional regulator [Cellulomonas fimi]|uniref:Transcriptional regulator, TetR family n=1 Tax=Cellulomonas fimi (strain ATCC 484 / DSM 20113 / JCM 1341 / CCUG 24087 / LMG 16345 / NBRC 15513 / NCIMB 8980 / NCTC 7547 / NRS-133) TaxID=590998 RepID=F4H7H4_CELFA|nr:TetR family transcriptional regulator [Cellulomonas fimi]AEE44531.1 transcriptional regulator, TetR family [Cellulomonas fimi ATCC 484]NNH06493.1 TetR family transcriptional regulator [Cellulomonas fimi]VEH26552.1 transcriptional regulator BetI [Cellulomonas fimi]